MNLAAHQRKLLGLFRSTYRVRSGDDPYIHRVSESKDLDEGRRNILLWRIFVLERTAVLTFNLLRRRHLLEDALRSFIERHNISPFRETQAPAFLEELSTHPDSLVASVAQFEVALLKVRQGDGATYSVRWDVEPYTVLHALARDMPLETNLLEGRYHIQVSRDLPSHFRIVPASGSAEFA